MGAFLVFDLSNRQSFEELTKWFDIIYESCESKVVISLIGNKADLIEKRVVSYDEAKDYAQLKNLNYVELSAKTGKNVSNAFNSIVEEIYKI